jgi:DNA-binding response OmpR family regulator
LGERQKDSRLGRRVNKNFASALGISYDTAIKTTKRTLAKTKKRMEQLLENPVKCLVEPAVQSPEDLINGNPALEIRDQDSFGDVVVDLELRRVSRQGRVLELSSKEFDLLKYFLCHPDEPLSRDRLLKEVWGHAQAQTTRTVDTHVAWLQQKLEPAPKTPKFIVAVRGVGYKFTSN